MRITINADERTIDAECGAGKTLLDVLRDNNVQIPAPCGGAGTCGKCRVLVTDADGTSFRLACETPAADGMQVAVETHEDLVVATAGAGSASDAGAASDASSAEGEGWGVADWKADGASTGYGIAVDLGTTTIACCLLDLGTGRMLAALGAPNPQVVFGADVISRISACQEGNLETMSELAREKIYSLAKDLCKEAGISPDGVGRMVIAANTTMEHILAGIDPTPIGVTPFIPPTLFGYEEKLFPESELGSGEGSAYMVPCVAGYVGGDVVTDLVSIDVLNQPKPVIILDLGTNGEMALGCESGIVSCATAAGPVFEGANIKFGMPAYNGAISRVGYERAAAAGDGCGRITYETIGGAKPKGICGTGLIDAVALMLDLGIVDESGYLNDADEVDPEYAHLICEDEDGGAAFMIADGIYITQKDIRCLQLAKSAVCAGIEAMLDHRSLKAEDIEALYIAGGFGVFLDLRNAARVGLFPQAMLACARSVGNSCLQGEAAMMCSQVARAEMDRISQTAEYMELSTSATFNSFYIDTMTFPEQ